MKKRSKEKEIMDLKLHTKEEYEGCLRQLGRIGRLLGSQKKMIEEIASVGKSSKILDVGCGGGDFAATLAKRFPHADVVASDIDEEAISYAKNKWKNIPNLTFKVRSLFEEEDQSFDIVTATLVCHHLEDDELGLFLKKGSSVAKKNFLCNDLHRHPIAYGLFAIVAPLLFRNRLIFHDGLLSIQRAFIRKDWEALLKEFPKYQIQWCWPFRWMIKI